MPLTAEIAQHFGLRPYSPSAAYARIGTVTLLREVTSHYMAQYPGADEHVKCQPQTVDLYSNGYYCKATFAGIVVARGYYGGDLNVPGTTLWHPYTYEVDAFLGFPHECHADSDIVHRTRASWGDTYSIMID